MSAYINKFDKIWYFPSVKRGHLAISLDHKTKPALNKCLWESLGVAVQDKCLLNPTAQKMVKTPLSFEQQMLISTNLPLTRYEKNNLLIHITANIGGL